jgi:predicted RND superfamily exporter protein
MWSARYCQFVERHARAMLVGVAVVFCLAAALASRIELRTAFSELLPSDDPGVVALARVQKRLGDLSLLLVGIRSPDREANLRYAETLTTRLRALPPRVCSLATYHVKDLKNFFEVNKWLYLSESDLTSIADRLRSKIASTKNPLLVDLADDGESLEDLQKRLGAKRGFQEQFPGGVFSDQDGRYVWVAAVPSGGFLGENSGEALYNAAQRIVREEDPIAFHPRMEAKILGPVASAIVARQAVENDILWVTMMCAVIVALSLVFFFRRFRSVPLIGIPAVIGTVMAFAVAELAFGYVNSSTAFLGSIILGNGINYAIVLMARYQEERASGASTPQALERAMSGVVRATAVSALCASGAYASLMLTSFRGFFQFGLMGSAGVLCCWLATFTALPAMLVVVDHRQHGQSSLRARSAPRGLGPLAALLGRHAKLVLWVSGILTIVSLWGLTHFARDPFEYRFRNLNIRTKPSAVETEFSENGDALFGRWPQPYIIIADRIEDGPAIKAAIRRQDAATPGPDVIDRIVTIHDVLPGTPAEQQRKLDTLSEIRRLLADPAVQAAHSGQQGDLDLAALTPPANLRMLTPADLPPLPRRPFTEVDGTIGRVVLVYYVEEGLSVWNGRDLLRISDVLQRIALPDGKTIDTGGSAVVFSSMIRSILHDAPIATLAALLVVLILTLATMRPPRAALLAIGCLLIGVVWMVGAAGWAEVKITFLNFIALPITFGIGAEYALNLVARHQKEGSMARSLAGTGSAVALCSWTTIVGYGSLLAANNRALQGFGAMAILGEVACLTAALVVLPSLAFRKESRKAEQSRAQSAA